LQCSLLKFRGIIYIDLGVTFTLTTKALSMFYLKRVEHELRRWLELLKDYDMEINIRGKQTWFWML